MGQCWQWTHQFNCWLTKHFPKNHFSILKSERQKIIFSSELFDDWIRNKKSSSCIKTKGNFVIKLLLLDDFLVFRPVKVFHWSLFSFHKNVSAANNQNSSRTFACTKFIHLSTECFQRIATEDISRWRQARGQNFAYFQRHHYARKGSDSTDVAAEQDEVIWA